MQVALKDKARELKGLLLLFEVPIAIFRYKDRKF